MVSLQNGVPEKHILTHLPAKNVVAGSVKFCGTSKGPGESALTTDFDTFKSFAFKIGEIDGSTTDRIKDVQSVLNHVGGTFISDNLMGTKWSKLLINSSFSGLSATTNSTFGDVADNDETVLAALNIINEGLEAGSADHVQFDELNNFDLSYFKKPVDGKFTDEQVATLRKLIEPIRKLEASML